MEAALANVSDALTAVVEVYQDTGRRLPSNAQLTDEEGPVWLETLVAT